MQPNGQLRRITEVNEEDAVVIENYKFRCGAVVTIFGQPTTRLTVIGNLKRNDGTKCCMVVWLDDKADLHEAALPEDCLDFAS